MARIALPRTDDVRQALGGGPTRLDDLRDDLDIPERDLAYALLRLVEDGEVAVFPVGDVVQVKPVDEQG
jgi:hypothetical protein